MGMRTDTVWLTRSQTYETIMEDGTKVIRHSSLGLSVKADSGETSADLYNAADRAVNSLMEREMERYLNREKAEKDFKSYGSITQSKE